MSISPNLTQGLVDERNKTLHVWAGEVELRDRIVAAIQTVL